MKTRFVAVLVLLLAAAAWPQTQDLGLGAFASEKGAIKLAVDAGLVDFNINNPYVMLVVYLAAGKNDQNITVNRKDLVMIYKDRELAMPGVAELRQNYNGEIRDIDFYRHLGKEGIVSSWIRLYEFPVRQDFFPPLTQGASLAVDEGSAYNFVGFRTKAYFKNPGFQKGDKFIIKVRDKKNPDLTGEVEVTLK